MSDTNLYNDYLERMNLLNKTIIEYIGLLKL